ncbi:phage tail protein [Aeromonas sp. QDB08]|uniref:phage tail protein n=1 Tax=Aeromonas sp. QDB08 TaxID=2990480 RepID=UPI0022DF6A6C|nr:phage tail protein [Aeromonas sp. QDB08]
MSAIYSAILTNAGQAKLANALALGVPLKITHMAVGDGNGQPVTPKAAQTALVREQRRAPINTLFQDPTNQSQLVAEQIIPENVGDWWIREAGIFSEDGTLIAIANTPDTYKPLLSSGAGRTQIIRMVLIVSDTNSVELKIDPAVVLATRKYVDDVMKAHKESRDHPDASETNKGFTRLATQEEVNTAAADDVAVTPKKMANHYRRANILGPVSQQNGMPTGAIIEQGSNANGSYIRFADGTQWCFAEVELILNVSKPNSFGSTAGQGYGPPDSVWYFPAPFISKPKAWGNPVGGEDHGTVAAHVSQLTNTFGIRRAWRVMAGPLTVQYFAVGRWY